MIGQISTESIDGIEPTILETAPPEIVDAVAELSAASAVLGAALHPVTAANLAALVRIMNSFYSHLIEGHHTRPRDIERALQGEFDGDRERRNLQLEAAGHVRVQAEVDRMAADGTLGEPAAIEFIRWLHREFYRDAPKDALRISGGGRELVMEPGAWRSRPEHDVSVGRHEPPSNGRVNDFMRRFETRYRFSEMGTSGKIMAIAASHHRFNYVHPFPDGNGRVSRLMSHAMALKAGIGAHGLWSVSRGLARGLATRSEYKKMMDLADSPRQGDLDGRGNLSQQALTEFIEWFLSVCLDQVNFMSGLFELDALSRRLRSYVERSETLKPEAVRLLEEALVRGRLERGEVPRVTGLPERTARRLLKEVIAEGLLGSETPKGPVSLRFPEHALDILFPRLYAQEWE